MFSRLFIKEIILVYIITSIVIAYPNIDGRVFFYLKTFMLIFLTLMCLLLALNKMNFLFFYKKTVMPLMVLMFLVVVYGGLTLTGLNFLLFSIWFIILFGFFGYCIDVNDLRLGFFATLALVVLNVLLLRVCLSAFNESLNYIYYTDSSYLELKNVGYNVGRTGWAISLILYICFLGGFKRYLSGSSKFKLFLINFAILLSCICVFLSDSRTGIIALILLLALWNFKFLKKRFKSGFFIVFIASLECLALLSGGVLVSFLSENTRLGTFSNSEDISNGRFDGVLIGIDIIADNLMLGTYPYKPYNLLDYGMAYPEIHVVWLNLMALYGFPLVLVTFLFITMYIYNGILLIYKNSNKYSKIDSDFLLFLAIFGFFITFVEPNGVVSFVSFSSIYWFVIGLFLPVSSKRYR